MRAEVRAFHLAGALDVTMAAYISAAIDSSCTERKIPPQDRSPNSLGPLLRETEPNCFLTILKEQSKNGANRIQRSCPESANRYSRQRSPYRYDFSGRGGRRPAKPRESRQDCCGKSRGGAQGATVVDAKAVAIPASCVRPLPGHYSSA